MIRRLLERLCRIDLRGPWTAEPRGGGPALDRTLEAEIRADERRRALSQENTAHGAGRRIGLYFPDGKVPR